MLFFLELPALLPLPGLYAIFLVFVCSSYVNYVSANDYPIHETQRRYL